MDNAAGLDAVIEADGVLVLGVLARGQEVLLAHEVGLVVHHERPALHPAGAALAQVRGDFRAVTDALVRAALEVSLLEEDDLERKTQIENASRGKVSSDYHNSNRNHTVLHGRSYVLQYFGTYTT